MDCSALLHILDYIATANEGDRHTQIREDMARVIANNSSQARHFASRALREGVTRRWRPGAQVDLVAELVEPVCDALFEGLLGVWLPEQRGDDVSPSQIFDVYLGLNRRKRVNAKARALLDSFSAKEDELKTSPEYATALSMLGYDSIAASLGCSLLHVLRESEGTRLCDVNFPKRLPATGVPYIERFATRNCNVAGADIRQGDRLRLFLDAGSSNQGPGQRPYFGRGRHSCLGEELSNWLWQTVVAELCKLRISCTLEDTRRRHPDWVFVYHSSILVRLDA